MSEDPQAEARLLGAPVPPAAGPGGPLVPVRHLPPSAVVPAAPAFPTPYVTVKIRDSANFSDTDALAALQSLFRATPPSNATWAEVVARNHLFDVPIAADANPSAYFENEEIWAFVQPGSKTDAGFIYFGPKSSASLLEARTRTLPVIHDLMDRYARLRRDSKSITWSAHISIGGAALGMRTLPATFRTAFINNCTSEAFEKALVAGVTAITPAVVSLTLSGVLAALLVFAGVGACSFLGLASLGARRELERKWHLHDGGIE